MPALVASYPLCFQRKKGCVQLFQGNGGNWGQIEKIGLSHCQHLENLSPLRLGTGPKMLGTVGTNCLKKQHAMIFLQRFDIWTKKRATQSGSKHHALGSAKGQKCGPEGVQRKGASGLHRLVEIGQGDWLGAGALQEVCQGFILCRVLW